MWDCRVRITGCARGTQRSAGEAAIGLAALVGAHHAEGGMPVM